MREKTDFNKLKRAFLILSDKDKLQMMDFFIKDMKNNRDLAKEVCGLAEKAYHPMLEIETWLEGRLTKHPSFSPKRVINECVKAKKLNKQMEPLLWGLARKVKKRVIKRIERKAKDNV